MSKPSVALVSGFWGQNIGNAFFNIGGYWILEQLFGSDNVAFVQDQPGYRTFHNQSKGNPRYDWGLLERLDVDYIVLQGPLLTETFQALWEPTLVKLKKRGTRVILLGAAFFRFTEREKRAATAFLEAVQPAVISTRDAESYEVIKDLARYAYSGLDSAFFVPKVYTPIQLATDPYIAINFDRLPEPSYTVGANADCIRKSDGCFEYGGETWAYKFPRFAKYMARIGKAQAYVGHFLDRRKLPSSINGYEIVRPEHRFNPHMTWKIYRQANAVASDEPFTYFTIYGNAALTLTDRVHACVATLAYGNPAMIYSPTKRAALLDRMGLSEIRQRPVSLSLSYLENERQRQMNFLADAIAQL